MRRVVLSMIISLDGFIAGPEGHLDGMISPDPEREAEHLQFLGSVDTILVGHGVYHDVDAAPLPLSQVETAWNAPTEPGRRIVFAP